MLARKRFINLLLDHVGKPIPSAEKVPERKGLKTMLSDLGVCSMKKRNLGLQILDRLSYRAARLSIFLECGIRVYGWKLKVRGEIFTSTCRDLN